MKSFFGKSNNIMFLQTFSVDQTRMWKSHSQMREPSADLESKLKLPTQRENSPVTFIKFPLSPANSMFRDVNTQDSSQTVASAAQQKKKSWHLMKSL